ncbi:MAG: carbohydrate binding family 9 domain-containing protein [Vicinamibacteria bacterium]|nr:carbohydrate binding family 9 domain-containing protein [Vicinamibacteria bacterium]
MISPLFLPLLLVGVQQIEPPAAPPARMAQTRSIARSAGAVKIDGVLDDEIWKTALAIPIEYEWQPGDNVKPPVETTSWVAFDERHIYIAFDARDPEPGKIRAHLDDRDLPFMDDTVGFFLDPFNDGRRGFQFRINPLGVQMDATNSDVTGDEDWSWDAIWESRGKINHDGYVVEVAIPFSSLRFPRTSGPQTWGFMTMRDWPRSERHRMRSQYFDNKRGCLVCQFDKLSGLQGMEPGRNLEITPTLTGVRTDLRPDFPRGPWVKGDADPSVGVSVRWSVTPNVALNAAVNPDFSQVEADVAQLDVNNSFALFYPEKRPFFLEGADIFSTPFPLVFTRTVADPDWGAKVTGKEGRNAFGAFAARDNRTNILIPGYDGSDEDTLNVNSTEAVARYRADVGEGSSMGAVATLREGGDYRNGVIGVDGDIRLGKADRLRFHAVASDTRYPDAFARSHEQKTGSFGGSAFRLRYFRETRDWFWEARAETLSPGFRADSGFVTQVGTRFVRGGAYRTFNSNGKKKWYTTLGFGAFGDHTESTEGGKPAGGFDFPIDYQGPKQLSLSYNPSPNWDYYAGKTYRNMRHNFGMSVRPSGTVTLEMEGSVGGTVDYANARQADQLRIGPSLGLKLGRSLSATLSHSYQKLDVAERRLFTANLTEVRAVYYISSRMFVRAIAQFTNIDRNPALYTFSVPARTRQLFSQFLFSYKVNAQTVALMGYSDSARGDQTIDVTRTDRTFFVKLGYAWLP